MPLLKTEADKLSNNQLISGVIEELIERDDLFAVLPFVQVNSKAYVYIREDVGSQNNVSLGSGLPTFLDPNDTVVEGAHPFVEVIAKLRIIAGDVDVDKFLQTVESNNNNQKALQLAQKAKAVGRKYHLTLATGDNGTNAKEFDGIAKLVTAGQTINGGANGAALTLAQLDQLVDMVPHGPDVLVMRRGTLRAVRTLLRGASGNAAVDIMMENFGRPMLSHNGVPIIINDYLPANEVLGSSGATTCSIYAMRLNEADGLHGLYGGPNAGMEVEEIGTVQNKDATRTRIKWYCGLALKSTQSLARLAGVTNT